MDVCSGLMCIGKPMAGWRFNILRYHIVFIMAFLNYFDQLTWRHYSSVQISDSFKDWCTKKNNPTQKVQKPDPICSTSLNQAWANFTTKSYTGLEISHSHYTIPFLTTATRVPFLFRQCIELDLIVRANFRFCMSLTDWSNCWAGLDKYSPLG